uniref:Uncharacterized protein n=1 Tax=Arundo donax TaxID=35708 RepID=A0A0A9FV25_ARUDO
MYIVHKYASNRLRCTLTRPVFEG